jgi:hypothetical protein
LTAERIAAVEARLHEMGHEQRFIEQSIKT